LARPRRFASISTRKPTAKSLYAASQVHDILQAQQHRDKILEIAAHAEEAQTLCSELSVSLAAMKAAFSNSTRIGF
jgi:hypothetical protein